MPKKDGGAGRELFAEFHQAGGGQVVASTDPVRFDLAVPDDVREAMNFLADHPFLPTFHKLLSEFHQHGLRRIPGVCPSLVNLCKVKTALGIGSEDYTLRAPNQHVAEHSQFEEAKQQYEADLKRVDSSMEEIVASYKTIFQRQSTVRPVSEEEQHVHLESVRIKYHYIKHLLKQKYEESLRIPHLKKLDPIVSSVLPSAPSQVLTGNNQFKNSAVAAAAASLSAASPKVNPMITSGLKSAKAVAAAQQQQQQQQQQPPQPPPQTPGPSSSVSSTASSAVSQIDSLAAATAAGGGGGEDGEGDPVATDHIRKIRRRTIPESSRKVLEDWLAKNFENPYPSGADKEALAKAAGLDLTQVTNWFVNERSRKWSMSGAADATNEKDAKKPREK